jgi:hypothetical protein
MTQDECFIDPAADAAGSPARPPDSVSSRVCRKLENIIAMNRSGGYIRLHQ